MDRFVPLVFHVEFFLLQTQETIFQQLFFIRQIRFLLEELKQEKKVIVNRWESKKATVKEKETFWLIV